MASKINIIFATGIIKNVITATFDEINLSATNKIRNPIIGVVDNVIEIRNQLCRPTFF
jgi:hypothetical protein